MKKSLLFIALFFCESQLMAQKATIAPFDSTFGSKVLQPFKVDSTWRVKPPALSTDQFFKQEDVDVSKLKLENQKPLLIAAEGYNMPILNLNNISKTPIVVLEGYSKMPVAGKGMTKAQKTTLVHP